jgi:predicted transcriptional regulator
MVTKITPEQRDALGRNQGPVLVEDDETHRLYYLVDEPTFDLLERQKDIDAIREGIADMEAGRLVTLDELDARIRSRLSMASRQ